MSKYTSKIEQIAANVGTEMVLVGDHWNFQLPLYLQGNTSLPIAYTSYNVVAKLPKNLGSIIPIRKSLRLT